MELANSSSSSAESKTAPAGAVSNHAHYTAGSSQCQYTNKEAPVLEKFDPQQQPKPKPQSQPQQQQEQELCTKDLLREWSPMYVARDNAEASASSWELTLDLASRVSGQMNDELDFELELWSENNEKVDLELKLWSENNEKVNLELKLGF